MDEYVQDVQVFSPDNLEIVLSTFEGDYDQAPLDYTFDGPFPPEHPLPPSSLIYANTSNAWHQCFGYMKFLDDYGEDLNLTYKFRNRGLILRKLDPELISLQTNVYNLGVGFLRRYSLHVSFDNGPNTFLFYNYQEFCKGYLAGYSIHYTETPLTYDLVSSPVLLPSEDMGLKRLTSTTAPVIEEEYLP
jgi:hypothetical protein